MGVLALIVAIVVVMATAAVLGRLIMRVRGRTRPSHVEIAHALMGLGMCAMYLPAVLPAIVWPVLFAGLAGWLTVLALQRQSLSSAHHVVGALAMVYMYLAPRNSAGGPISMFISSSHHMQGHTMAVSAHTPGYAMPLVAWFLAIYCLLSAGFAGTDIARDHQRRNATVELILSGAMAYTFLTTL